MQSIKKIIVGVAFVGTIAAPAIAHAVPIQLIDVSDAVTNPARCMEPDGEFTEMNITEGCDLSVDKQVSVNGGAYAEADTSAEAAMAQVGDTVTWKVTVTDTSDEGLVPYGKVTVHDVLPSGAAYDSYTASAGTYDGSDWSFMLSGNLPATLTITSHAVSTGLFKNTAALSQYDACMDGCLGGGLYSDSDLSNNSNDAWFDPSAAPVVLAATTELTNTGQGIAASAAAGGLILAALAASFLGRRKSHSIEH